MDTLIIIVLGIIVGLTINYYLVKGAVENEMSEFEIQKYRKQQDIEYQIKTTNDILRKILRKIDTNEKNN
ncbi:hypothetical protein [Empedobacter sp. GD03865]|uniref:hypothetical protein n=1 Tax=Empedobacter sp. GD03865 TaxID=2975392 RepID=UPI002446ECFE|nr:hypothetical protein [Empedobacter sp. GD03865]MDH0660092.1 hypothetical protein [Empedobacter sp. GD03865]